MTRQEVPPLLSLSGDVLEAQWDRVGHITLSDRCRRPVGREKKKKPRCLIFGTRTIAPHDCSGPQSLSFAEGCHRGLQGWARATCGMRLIGEIADLHSRDGECFTMYQSHVVWPHCAAVWAAAIGLLVPQVMYCVACQLQVP